MDRPTTLALLKKRFSWYRRLLLRLSLCPSARIELEETDLENLPLGASRFGGVPDVPPHLEWPEWMAPETEFVAGELKHVGSHPSALDFIAQVHLADVADLALHEHLPSSGWLYFFYDAIEQPWGFDPKGKGGARVIYYDGEVSSLRRGDHPDRDEGGGPFQACQLSFTAQETLPTQPCWWGTSEKKTNAYEELLGELYGQSSTDDGLHRLLGHPQVIQYEMELECQLVTHGLYCGNPSGYADPKVKRLAAGAAEWLLLLQVDSDDVAQWMWGDCGRLYYWIRESDFQQRRFDRIWAILQCY